MMLRDRSNSTVGQPSIKQAKSNYEEAKESYLTFDLGLILISTLSNPKLRKILTLAYICLYRYTVYISTILPPNLPLSIQIHIYSEFSNVFPLASA